MGESNSTSSCTAFSSSRVSYPRVHTRFSFFLSFSDRTIVWGLNTDLHFSRFFFFFYNRFRFLQYFVYPLYPLRAEHAIGPRRQCFATDVASPSHLLHRALPYSHGWCVCWRVITGLCLSASLSVSSYCALYACIYGYV